MPWLPVLCGAVVGLALGLTGGGGSIFAVPLLHFTLGMPLREAVAASLAVVGLTSLYGAVIQRHEVRWLGGAVFGVGGILSAPAGAWTGAHMPEAVTLLLFATLMIFIGIRSWAGFADTPGAGRFSCKPTESGERRPTPACALKLAAAGAFTGVLSGIFGVGGGFLVVPALIIVTRMPVCNALATSLVAIFLISLSGFLANVAKVGGLDYATSTWFLLGAGLGMTAGAAIKKRLPAAALRKIFALVVIGTAIWITVRVLL